MFYTKELTLARVVTLLTKAYLLADDEAVVFAPNVDL